MTVQTVHSARAPTNTSKMALSPSRRRSSRLSLFMSAPDFLAADLVLSRAALRLAPYDRPWSSNRIGRQACRILRMPGRGGTCCLI
jgi:hypothetical protein